MQSLVDLFMAHLVTAIIQERHSHPSIFFLKWFTNYVKDRTVFSLQSFLESSLYFTYCEVLSNFLIHRNYRHFQKFMFWDHNIFSIPPFFFLAQTLLYTPSSSLSNLWLFKLVWFINICVHKYTFLKITCSVLMMSLVCMFSGLPLCYWIISWRALPWGRLFISSVPIIPYWPVFYFIFCIGLRPCDLFSLCILACCC